MTTNLIFKQKFVGRQYIAASFMCFHNVCFILCFKKPLDTLGTGIHII